jgi:putative CocE/NonD family hydrolase
MKRSLRTSLAILCAALIPAFASMSCSDNTEPQEPPGPSVDPKSTVDGEKTANPTYLARDGVALDTYVYLPAGPGPYPTLVVRTLYGVPISPIGGYASDDDAGDDDDDDDAGDDDDDDDVGDDDDDLSPEEAARIGWPLLTDSGYALVIQVTRGRFRSGGVDRSWLDDGPDGYDLVEWVAAQPWSDGKIGLFGDSATGASALLAAAANPPSLDAVYVQVAPGNGMGEDFLPDDGADKLESLMVQGASIAVDVGEEHLAARGIGPGEVEALFADVQEYLMALFGGLEDPLASPEWMALPVAQRPSLSRLMPYWDAIFSEDQSAYRDGLDATGRIQVPVYAVTVWQDVFLKSSVQLHEDLQARGVPSRLMVLNGAHYDINDPSIWPKRVMLDWFDHHLRGVDNGIEAGPPVEFQVQGAGAALQATSAWPPPSSALELYLAGDGSLSSSAPASSEPARELVYDPEFPVPTLGGLNLLAPSGISDHSVLLDRGDVLTYVGEPLESDGALAGRITASLYVATDRVDTDFMIKLLDIDPTGSAHAIAEDEIRLRNRNGRASPSLVNPGEVLELAYDLGPSAYLFRAGHRVGVLITSSNFPAWDRNTNTGLPSWATSEVQTAVNSVFSDAGRPSKITLPWSSELR